MEHPWILLGSILGSSPLIWMTFRFFFLYLRDDLSDDGPWILFDIVTDIGIVTWTMVKFFGLLLVSASYVYILYKIISLFLA
jgi:hypothetical protein